MTSFRGLRRPPDECAARSSGPRYASTSTSRPQSRFPSTSRTSTLPRRSRATATVSRSKKSGPRTRPDGGAPASDRGFANLLPAGLSAALVHVQSLVRALVHRLPVHPGPPRRNAHAEFHGNRKLGRAVQVLERLADSHADVASVALVSLRHRNPKLVAPEAAASVAGTDGPLQLLRKHANRLVPHVMPIRVVDVLEAVEVDHHQGQAATVAVGGCDRAVDGAFELGAVGKTGQIIGPRLLGVLAGPVQGDRDLVGHGGHELEVA